MYIKTSTLRNLFISALFTLGLVFSSCSIAAKTSLNKKSQNAEIQFGVFPYLAPRLIHKIYAPIGNEFASVLNQKVLFLTSSSYKKFMHNLNKEMYDIVFVQPFDYVDIADKYGYKPLAVRNEKLPAILVVRQDSPLKQKSSLKNKIIGLPPRVAAISFLVKNYLTKNGLVIGKNVTVKHFRSHYSCMHALVIKSIDVCGTAPPAVRVFQSKMNKKLRVIAKTASISNSLFAIHPRVPPEQVEALRKNIHSWQNTDKGKRLLKGAKVKAFVDVSDSQYDEVRKMAKRFRR